MRRLEWRQEIIRVSLAVILARRRSRLGNSFARVGGLSLISQVEGFLGLRPGRGTIEPLGRALRTYGLSFPDVATAIRRDSMNVSVGEVPTQTGMATACRESRRYPD
ncbi:MAG: hypothetical protein CM15mP103_07780 [Gammaproteobacteria bacterium]|nr:MAG: hypothetical protein CM15mP103_07780 [Gammaproteobacteria bacterium]